MNPMIYIVVAIISMIVIFSCTKNYETKKQPTSKGKNISPFLTKSAKEYSAVINTIADHIDDTLIFQCQGASRFIPNLDAFKSKYIDSIALGIGKNVYLGFTGDNSTQYLKLPNGSYVHVAELGNLCFYIYEDFYQLEPDSTYSIVNLRFLYNLTEPPFK